MNTINKKHRFKSRSRINVVQHQLKSSMYFDLWLLYFVCSYSKFETDVNLTVNRSSSKSTNCLSRIWCVITQLSFYYHSDFVLFISLIVVHIVLIHIAKRKRIYYEASHVVRYVFLIHVCTSANKQEYYIDEDNR